jgi:hypothetical protein
LEEEGVVLRGLAEQGKLIDRRDGLRTYGHLRKLWG